MDKLSNSFSLLLLDAEDAKESSSIETAASDSSGRRGLKLSSSLGLIYFFCFSLWKVLDAILHLLAVCNTSSCWNT